jgi:hypothetical protein
MTCWLFEGAKTPTGYGKVWIERRCLYVHRVAYELLVGPIPEGYEIDHLCKNRACYNPAHLEPVTRQENIKRSDSGGWQRTLTHCIRGHEFDRPSTPGQKRQCNTCARIRYAERCV